MKALFYFPINVDTSPNSGIVKKNEHIISSIKKLGVEADVITFSFKGIHLNGTLIKKVANVKFNRGLNNYILAYKAVARKIDFKKYDFIWLRAPLLCLPPFFNFVKNIKKDNPKTKIILEYGAFPFFDELTKYQRLFYPISNLFTKYLKNYVSYVITYCGQDEIFGIPNIKIGNGVQVKKINWSEQAKPLNGTMHLVSVSSLLPWHACDRVVEGIKNYYANQNSSSKIDVVLHIVGYEENSTELKQIVADAQLENNVVFHGFKINKELDDVFEQCHVAVGTLGMHRINLHASSSLKNREYFSRAKPFILAAPDADFPEELPFVKYIASNESPVDIPSIIEFYENITTNYPNYPSLIRKYAEDNLTWRSKLQTVINAVKDV